MENISVQARSASTMAIRVASKLSLVLVFVASATELARAVLPVHLG